MTARTKGAPPRNDARRPGPVARYRLGGLLLLLALTYFVGEAWAAAGWEGRPYRWTVDAISSLGVPETMWTEWGRADSTRHVAMNATFVATGVRVLLVGLVLAPFVPRRGRWAVQALVLAHGAGLVLVGLYPTGVTAVRESMHGLGAVLAIIGGGALLVALTLSLARRYRALAAVTGVLAVASTTGIVCILAGVGDFGLVERLAVYPVVVWQAVAGTLVLRSASPGRA